jgi:chorismate dehydratase
LKIKTLKSLIFNLYSSIFTLQSLLFNQYIMTLPQPQNKTLERLGIVSYTNVAPLHWGLEPWEGIEFVRGVPTELNQKLLSGEIDLTLISSIEFLRYRHFLKALPDFSISTLGPVRSVMLFHWEPWEALQGKTIAVTTDSATSVHLLKVLLKESKLETTFLPMQPVLDAMLQHCDAALLIGDTALIEAVQQREINGRQPLITDLGEAWYALTKLPFTFAVWASRKDNPPSEMLVNKLRGAREYGLGHLGDVSQTEAKELGLPAAMIQHYLANFRYYLEPPDIDGLMLFAEKALSDFNKEELEFWS